MSQIWCLSVTLQQDCSELTILFVNLPTLYVIHDPHLRLQDLEQTPELITCLVLPT